MKNTFKEISLWAVVTLALFALAILPACAQQPAPNGYAFSAITGNPPVLVSSIAGTAGNTTAYYVLIAKFPGGSIPSNVLTVRNVPDTLDTTNYVSFAWNLTAGATTYDLLKLTSTALPSGSTSVALHASLGATVTTSVDQGTGLSSYTIAAQPTGGIAQITLNSRDYAKPVVEFAGQGSLLPGLGQNGFPLYVTKVTTDATTTGVTLAAAGIVNGFYVHAPTGAVNDTTATATQIIAALPNCYVNGTVGTSFNFTFVNNSAGANTVTILAGAGVTLQSSVSPLTVVQAAVQSFRGVVTNCTTPAVSLYSLGNAITY